MEEHKIIKGLKNIYQYIQDDHILFIQNIYEGISQEISEYQRNA